MVPSVTGEWPCGINYVEPNKRGINGAQEVMY